MINLNDSRRFIWYKHRGLPFQSFEQNECWFLIKWRSYCCIINPLLTKLVRSRWLDIRLILFPCYWPRLSLDHESARKELDQYLALVTSRLFNNAYRIRDASVTNCFPVSDVIWSTMLRYVNTLFLWPTHNVLQVLSGASSWGNSLRWPIYVIN